MQVTIKTLLINGQTLPAYRAEVASLVEFAVKTIEHGASAVIAYPHVGSYPGEANEHWFTLDENTGAIHWARFTHKWEEYGRVDRAAQRQAERDLNERIYLAKRAIRNNYIEEA